MVCAAQDAQKRKCEIERHGRAVDEEGKKIRCIYCGKVVSGYNQLEHHLASKKGNIYPCKKVPDIVKVSINNTLEDRNKDMIVRELKYQEFSLRCNMSPPSAQVERPLFQPTTSSMDGGGCANANRCYLQFSQNSMATTQENGDNVSTGVSSYRQRNRVLEDCSHCMLNKQAEMSLEPAVNSWSHCTGNNSSSQLQESKHLMEANVDSHSLAAKSIGKFIFEAGLEPGVLQLPSFKGMVDVLVNGSQLAMPTYESILQEQLRDIHQRARELKQQWEQSGCSVILDSWKSQCGKCYISVLVHCNKGMYFLRSMDVSVIIDDVDELALMLSHVVDDIGVCNIVQVITNDASPYMQAAEHAVLKKHGHSFFFTLCADYCINLLLENIATLGHVNVVLTKAREITRFIYSHKLPMELKGKYVQGGEILSSSNFKFVAIFITLERLVCERINLVEMFSSPEWASSDWDSRSSFRHICEVVKTDDAFWCAAAEIVKLTNPLVTVLYKLETDDCPMGILYDSMDSAKEDIEQNLGHKHDGYWHVVDDIWNNYLHTPLHAVGYNLNPRIFYSGRFCLDTEISSGVAACINQMAKGHYDSKKAAAELKVYQRKSGPFDPDLLATEQIMGMPQVAWWSAHGTETPELQKFAIRVLSQTCFGSSRYNNIDWGLSEQLHAVKNYTEQEILRKREYLHYNIRLANAVPSVGGASGAQHGKLTTQLGDWISEQEVQHL